MAGDRNHLSSEARHIEHAAAAGLAMALAVWVALAAVGVALLR